VGFNLDISFLHFTDKGTQVLGTDEWILVGTKAYEVGFVSSTPKAIEPFITPMKRSFVATGSQGDGQGTFGPQGGQQAPVFPPIDCNVGEVTGPCPTGPND